MFGGIAIIIISICAIIIGVHLWQKGDYLLKTGKKAEAIIYRNNYSNRAGNDNGVYYPVVRFLTDKQEWITQELSIGYRPAKKEGTKLEILYDPEDPYDVQINSRFYLEVLPRILVVLGIFALAFGVLELLGITQIIAD